MANKTFLKIVTPKGYFFEKLVDMVQVRTPLGNIGLQAGKSPFIASLSISELIINPESKSRIVCAISGGFVNVTPTTVDIITDEIELKADINQIKVNNEIQVAQHKLKQKLSYSEHLKTQILLKKAINKIKVSNS